jgi:hypothetical protein
VYNLEELAVLADTADSVVGHISLDISKENPASGTASLSTFLPSHIDQLN